MKKLTFLQFFISGIQKKISSALEEKLMQKLEEKTLKKSWKNWIACSMHNLGSVRNSRLADKSRLSVKSCSAPHSRLAHRSGLAREGSRGKV